MGGRISLRSAHPVIFCGKHSGKPIDGKDYYFVTEGDKIGRVYANERTPDGYFVGADGVRKK